MTTGVWRVTCAGGIRLFTDDGAGDPETVIALGVAGAEAAEGVVAGLEPEWALYTPQQAAVLASALCDQIDTAAVALEKLGEYLHLMAERGDVEMPEFGGTGKDRNLDDAYVALGAAGQEVQGALQGRAADAVAGLVATPYLGELPTSAHETITGVAELLGARASLITDHHLHDEKELAENYGNGFGCGCRIELTDDAGAAWDFQRGDSAWCLARLDDVDADRCLRSWLELENSEATAHPAHLVMLIRQSLAAPATVAAG